MVAALTLAGCGNNGSATSAPSTADLERRYVEQVFATVEVTSDVQYGEPPPGADPAEYQLDIYEPAGDTETNRPLVMVMHGGAFVAGDKAASPFVAWGQDLARRGYVVASVNYRLEEELAEANAVSEMRTFGFPEETMQRLMDNSSIDVRAAMTYLQAHADDYGIDPNRVVALGNSAGAYLALALVHRADETLDGEVGTSVQAAVSVSGAMPVGVVNSGAAPVLMAHGVDDDVIPFDWGEKTCEAIVQFDSPCEFHEFPGGHTLNTDRLTELAPLAAEFFAANVGS